MSVPFLLEIGTEEIPDWMIPAALANLRLLFEKIEVPYESVALDATPRRLVLRAEGLPERQPDSEERVMGPAKSAPAQAVAGFARKHGLKPEDLGIETTPKGQYYSFVKKVEGRPTKDILAEALPGLILQIYFPKTMYWTGKGGPRFIRPIRWIVALLGEDIVPFELAGVHSGSLTSGHRRLGAREIVVTIADYERRLRDHYVILSAEERRRKLMSEMAGVRVKKDDALLETLVYITEYPTPITGSFDTQFLELPEEVLITVMRHHQKYFSVEDVHGKLAPHFVAVMNIDADREGFVRRGNERVLRARFNDARFFWETDQKKKLADRVQDLKAVTFLKDLKERGSYHHKVERMLAMLSGDAHAARAAELSKCDLTTELVKEFTELQGIVGGLYARVQGEPEPVWQAIYDHYKPESMEDAIPRNRAGQMVSIADKIDTLRSCFSVGLVPTGSRDPYALRRAAQGVVRILVEGEVEIPLLDLLGGDQQLLAFFDDRMRYYFGDVRGFKYDEVNAVMNRGHDRWDLKDLEASLIRIQRLRPTPDFEPVAASAKRIWNILDQASFSEDVAFNPGLLEDGPERDLYEEYLSIKGQPIENAISRLRPKIDLFFDKVLVNAPQPDVRQNRLTLLYYLWQQFYQVADFSEIVTNS
ncbi:Glycine--tRNA ligase beta subunit [Candidatus Sulfopaludibacter sp. SbA6]|nr:Glycine--tRNA ligase beta subunit [Candidatus Sulfopaludibacter sp. SbA6]